MTLKFKNLKKTNYVIKLLTQPLSSAASIDLRPMTWLCLALTVLHILYIGISIINGIKKKL